MWFCENFYQHLPQIFSVLVPTFRKIFPSQMIFRSLRIEQHMSQECLTGVNKSVLENFGEILKFVSTRQMKQQMFARLLTPKIKTKANFFLSRFIFKRETHARNK